MKKRNKGSKKKKYIISLIVILLLLLLIAILYILLFNKDLLEYKSKITIEVGSTIPSISDFLYNDEEIEEEIIWDNLESTDGKIYKVGTYTGKFNYKKEEKEVTLVVKDTTAPIISGTKDIEMLAYEKEPNLLEGIMLMGKP